MLKIGGALFPDPLKTAEFRVLISPSTSPQGKLDQRRPHKKTVKRFDKPDRQLPEKLPFTLYKNPGFKSKSKPPGSKPPDRMDPRQRGVKQYTLSSLSTPHFPLSLSENSPSHGQHRHTTPSPQKNLSTRHLPNPSPNQKGSREPFNFQNSLVHVHVSYQRHPRSKSSRPLASPPCGDAKGVVRMSGLRAQDIREGRNAPALCGPTPKWIWEPNLDANPL